MPFSINDQHFGAFSNIEKESNFGIEKCRLCLGQCALLETCSWKPTAPTTPRQSHHRGLGTRMSTEPLLKQTSVFLRVNRKEDTWTDVFKQPSLLRSLPCRFPKSWCACGFYNEEGFVCWRIFSALLLNSKVRRGVGARWELLSFAFPNSPNLSLVCPETAAKIVLKTWSQKFYSWIGPLTCYVARANPSLSLG